MQLGIDGAAGDGQLVNAAVIVISPDQQVAAETVVDDEIHVLQIAVDGAAVQDRRHLASTTDQLGKDMLLAGLSDLGPLVRREEQVVGAIAGDVVAFVFELCLRQQRGYAAIRPTRLMTLPRFCTYRLPLPSMVREYGLVMPAEVTTLWLPSGRTLTIWLAVKA